MEHLVSALESLVEKTNLLRIQITQVLYNKIQPEPQKHNEAVWDGLPRKETSWVSGGCQRSV